MDTTVTTLQLPTTLYVELEALATAEQVDLITLLTILVREGCQRHKWKKGWRELSDQIQRDGGLKIGGTTEEIVEQMRKTRQEVFEAEYAHLYR